MLLILLAIIHLAQLCACLGGNEAKELPSDQAMSNYLYLPEDFETLFVFATSPDKMARLPEPNSSVEQFSTFVQHSIPFRFRSYFALTDFFVIQQEEQATGGPSPASPVMAVLLTETQPEVQANPDQFWDATVSHWVGRELMQTMLYSTFCTFVANDTATPGYCIRLRKDNTIQIFNVTQEELGRALFSQVQMVGKDPSAEAQSSNSSTQNVGNLKEFKVQVVDPSTLGPPLMRNGATVALKHSLRAPFDDASVKEIREKLKSAVLRNVFSPEKSPHKQSTSIATHELGVTENPREKYHYSQNPVPSEALLAKMGHKLNGKFIRREVLMEIMDANELVNKLQRRAVNFWMDSLAGVVAGAGAVTGAVADAHPPPT